MKILIATGIYPPDIGGPAQFARGVEEAWRKAGHEVKVLAFRFERELPTGIRHLYYFLRVLFSLRGVDFIFSPDTWSAAFPATIAAKLFGKKIIIRTGGDFLWEQFVERTGDLVLLRDFYSRINATPNTRIHPNIPNTDATQIIRMHPNIPNTDATQIIRMHPNMPKKRGELTGLNRKERAIFHLLRFLFRHADATVFSTKWQRDIFEKPYHLDLEKCFVVENYYATPNTRIHPNMPNTDATQIIRMHPNIPNTDATQIIRMHPNMPNGKEIVEKELSYKLGGVFFSVQNALGRFCRERQYSDALAQKLGERGINFKRELSIEVAGRKSNFADFVVEGRMLVEVKAKPFVGKDEYYQVMRYLEAMDLELGLIVNFQSKYLKPQRVLNPKYSKRTVSGSVHLVYSGGSSDSSGRIKVFVGGTRELKWKNMPRLQEAFAQVQKKGLPVELKWETGSRGKFLQDVQGSYAVIIASLGDVSPNTILEAISFGKPFILTRETGLYDKLKDIGVWVNPESVEDIAAKIEWLADERNYAEQCKKVAAFSFTHSYEEIAGEIVALYSGLNADNFRQSLVKIE